MLEVGWRREKKVVMGESKGGEEWRIVGNRGGVEVGKWWKVGGSGWKVVGVEEVSGK